MPLTWADFAGQNAGYLAELYECFRADPSSVDAATRAAFEKLPSPAAAGEGQGEGNRRGGEGTALVAGSVGLARAIRAYGHKAAQLDPLGTPPPGDPALEASFHGISEQDLAGLPADVVRGPVAHGIANAREAIQHLRQVYESTTGYEFEHVSVAEERYWLHDAVVTGRYRPPQDPIDERKLLERLTEVGSFERFLQRAFPGQTRFSLEGLGMLVPMLDEIIGSAAEAGTRAVMLGMGHRGRLNVLAHVLGKPYEQIIAEFLGRYPPPNTSASGSSDVGWTGDVKYHLGARRAYSGGREVAMTVMLAPNPSHLEFVDPIVAGMTRAYGERRDGAGPPRQDEQGSLALLVHGDASFPGEGVVAETLNLSHLPGYRTGGAIHLITNNQLGFTAGAELTRSTLYASDLAKGFEMPVIHVNADDPEACIAAVRLAHAYRERFRKDAVIDLVGYRRYGHNEGDEPSFTQPRMYATIAQHPTVRELWAREMVRRGLMTEEEAQASLQTAIEELHAIRRRIMETPAAEEGEPMGQTAGIEAGGPGGGIGSPGPAPGLETAVHRERLASLNQQLYSVPTGFHLHPKLKPALERRRTAFDPHPNALPEGEGTKIDWAQAETLALASILADGTPIRLTGQDTARGTFSQRHLVLHDYEIDATHIALQRLADASASFEVWDSPLSETATLGFEFGYNVMAPEALVLWEAQYGDFVNVAQVIIDQFIVSARSKWGQQPSLVLLLPHGYEGQGPEHSSAHLERFLQLAAEDNLRIANCSTAAQYFHILRRQAGLLASDPRPLVLLTPKSLLRHPLATSAPEELSHGRFRPLVEDASAAPDRAQRLILCSGKIAIELAAAERLPAEGAAVARVEELYPFPAADVAELVGRYPKLREVAWVQEEPRDMGAWTYVAPRLRDILAGRLPLLYIGRTRRASSAEGAYEWHMKDQRRIIDAALDLVGARPAEDAAIVTEAVRGG